MERLKYLLRILENGKKNICYGAGEYGWQLWGFLQAHGYSIDYFVVTKKDSGVQNILGVPVTTVSAIENAGEYNWLVGVSKKYSEEITNILASRQIFPCFVMEENDIADMAKDAVNMVEDVLAVNKEIHNVASKKKRCFIMGTGGSIRFQNLKYLSNEDVFSCSYCSLLDDYTVINPKFYILPALIGDPVRTSTERDIYIREKLAFFSKTITSNVIFCDYFDRNYIRYYEAFKGKKIYYLYQFGDWNERRGQVYNLCRKTPIIQTGAIMMLKVAMYMGYKKIYLIGTEHDLVTHKYGHAYDLRKMKELGFEKLLNISLSQNVNIEKRSNRQILSMSLNMYNQYYYLHNIAKQNGIEIYNATEGGSLDEFERVKFETLF